MKFISKSSNLLIVLRQGVPGSHITGVPAKAMISARFKDGVFENDDQSIVEMLVSHPAYGSDFVSAEETNGVDPYAYLRDTGPEHVTTVIKNGQPIGSGKPAPVKLPPEVLQAIQAQSLEMAKKMALEMAPVLAKEYIDKALAEHNAAREAGKAPSKPKGKKGVETEVA